MQNIRSEPKDMSCETFYNSCPVPGSPGAFSIVLLFLLVLVSTTVAQTSDPYCFLPIGQGNSWTFRFNTPSGPDSMTFAITDTLERSGKTYNRVESPLNFEYLRYDGAGHVFQYLPRVEREILLFDFTAEAPDTHRINLPQDGLLFDVILRSRSDVVEVPAGRFENCLHFTLDYLPDVIDDEQEVWLAPQVGFVRAYPVFDTAYNLVTTDDLMGCQAELSAGASHFPIQLNNKWTYKFAQSFAEPRTLDSMRVIQNVDFNGHRYYRFDRYLPLFNLSDERFDSTLVRVDGHQVYVILDSTEFLWYDFDLMEDDTITVTIPFSSLSPGDSLALLVWKEVESFPIFLHESTPYRVTAFHFFPKDPSSAIQPAIDQFVQPWGLASHIHGAIDPFEYYLSEAFVSGQVFSLNPVSVKEKEANTPSDFALYQNYPNPFNPETTIGYELVESNRVTLTIYNLLGQRVRTLVDEWQAAGNYRVVWDGSNDDNRRLASSLYIYELRAGSNMTRRKMILLQ